MTPMISPAIAAAATQFTDPEVRARVLKMHEENKPFVEMAGELGIVFEGALRDAIAGLSAKEVATIRTAMVAAINRGDGEMPIDCELKTLPAKIVVDPEDIGGAPWAKVTAAQ